MVDSDDPILCSSSSGWPRVAQRGQLVDLKRDQVQDPLQAVQRVSVEGFGIEAGS